MMMGGLHNMKKSLLVFSLFASALGFAQQTDKAATEQKAKVQTAKPTLSPEQLQKQREMRQSVDEAQSSPEFRQQKEAFEQQLRSIHTDSNYQKQKHASQQALRDASSNPELQKQKAAIEGNVREFHASPDVAKKRAEMNHETKASTKPADQK